MTPFQEQTLLISIFYDRSGWDRLIGQCLMSSLTKYENEGKLKTYSIRFAYEQGDHIQLVISPLSKEGSLADDLKQQILTFLRKEPSERPERKIPFTSLFMDFDNNSCFSNLFFYTPPQSAVLPKDIWAQLRKESSNLIMKNFGGETVEPGNILNFMVSILLVTSHSRFSGRKAAHKAVSKLYRDSIAHAGQGARHRVEKLSRSVWCSNSGELRASTDSLWGTAPDIGNFRWLDEWKAFLSKLPSGNVVSSRLYPEILGLFNDQLHERNRDLILTSLLIAGLSLARNMNQAPNIYTS